MKRPGDSTKESLTDALESVLQANGFATKRELILYDTAFDIVAEDESRLVFVTVRSDNDGWLDDFHDQQAALGTAASEVRLGRKWRDVYLIEVTTDALDTGGESKVAQEIRGDTLAARKLVVDASSVDPADQSAVEDLVRGFILGPRVDSIHSDINVLASLQAYLIGEGFDEDLVAGVIDGYSSDKRHSCLKLVLETISDEAHDDRD